MIFYLKSKVPNSRKNEEFYKKIEDLESEKDLTRQYEILPIIIASISEVNINSKGVLDSLVTRAGFVGFIFLELLNTMHPISRNDHIICLLIIAAFFIHAFATYNR